MKWDFLITIQCILLIPLSRIATESSDCAAWKVWYRSGASSWRQNSRQRFRLIDPLSILPAFHTQHKATPQNQTFQDNNEINICIHCIYLLWSVDDWIDGIEVYVIQYRNVVTLQIANHIKIQIQIVFNTNMVSYSPRLWPYSADVFV